MQVQVLLPHQNRSNNRCGSQIGSANGGRHAFSKFDDFGTVWVEKTKSSHGHGGKDWEFGTCLWSPTTDKSGKHIYKNMLAAHPGDLVLHFYEDTPFGNELDHYLCGLSVVDAAATIREEPPMPGEWAGRGEYYRIGLRAFKSFADPQPLRQFVRYHEAEILEAIESLRGRALRGLQWAYPPSAR